MPVGSRGRPALTALLRGQELRCEGHKRDRYYPLVRCWIGDVDVGRDMVRQGWAVCVGIAARGLQDNIGPVAANVALIGLLLRGCRNRSDDNADRAGSIRLWVFQAAVALTALLRGRELRCEGIKPLRQLLLSDASVGPSFGQCCSDDLLVLRADPHIGLHGDAEGSQFLKATIQYREIRYWLLCKPTREGDGE